MNEQLKNLLISLEISEENINKILESDILKDLVSKTELDALVLEQTAKFAIDAEISLKLSNVHAKNIKACKALIDKEKISFDGQKISGLNEQIEKIVSENPYLFEDFSYVPVSGENKPCEQNMTDQEYFNYLKLNNNGGF